MTKFQLHLLNYAKYISWAIVTASLSAFFSNGTIFDFWTGPLFALCVGIIWVASVKETQLHLRED